MSKDPNETPQSEKFDPGVHDISFMSRRTLLGALVIFLGIIVTALVAAAVLILVPYALNPAPTEIPRSFLQGTTQPGQVNLQVNPEADFNTYRSTEQAYLNGYGYIDKDKDTAHIPVNDAMKLWVDRGMPTVVAGLASGTPAGPLTGSPEQQGAQLFQSLGCNGCHGDQNGVAPTLRGVFGSQVKLADGSTVTADEAYIKESIINPNAKVVAGFAPIMPSFQGRVDDTQLAALVAYVKSLAAK